MQHTESCSIAAASVCAFILSLLLLSLILWGSVTVLVWGWGPSRQAAVLVTYMRDELGSCAPGSFTAVALFYIYGAAAGPAVARCESHDSSAGNRDGPVILAPHWLHITLPALLVFLATHRSTMPSAHRHMRVCVRTHTHSFVPFTDTSIHLFSGTLSLRLCTVVSISNSINPPMAFYLSFYS